MIDLHSHVLPDFDDGPATLEGALELARAAAYGGTRTLAATPHVDYKFMVSPRRIPGAVAELNTTLRDEGIALEIIPGAEISLSRLGDLDEEDLAAVRLGDGPYLLLESPHTSAAGDFDRMLFELRLRGVNIVLAHPERCPTFQREPRRLERLCAAGVLCSITAGSLGGRFGETVRGFTVGLLRDGLVHNVASDAHDHERRPPDLLAGFERAESELPGISAQIGWFTEEAPAAILRGERLPPRPEAPTPRKRRRRWLIGGRRGGA